MNKNKDIFVKIKYKMNSKAKDILKNLNWKTNGFKCYGIVNKNYCTLVFKMNNIEQANKIASNNPFMNLDLYNLEIV